MSVMTVCLFLGRAIGVASELKERSEVSQRGMGGGGRRQEVHIISDVFVRKLPY